MTSDGTPAKPGRRVKKSETLEVRIPHETKQAFLTACREDGTTASEVVRDQVQAYLDQRKRPSQQEHGRSNIMHLPQSVRRYGPRVAAGGIAAIGLATLAVLPSAAAPDFKAQFGRLDANGDGVLSVDEFLGPKDDGATSNEERKIVIESRVTTSGDDVKASVAPSMEMRQEAFMFWLPDELGAAGAEKAEEKQHQYKFISHREVKELKDGEPAPGAVQHTMTFTLDDIRKQEFGEIDTNKDGKVSLDEYKARQTAMLTRGFDLLDTNSDKTLSQDEYAKIVAPPMVKLNWQANPDMPEPPKIEVPGMKTVSPEALKAAFSRLDSDKDGKLSLQEYLPKG
jgi:Ca2+-binding EF-hand superfamily protein